MGWVDKFVDDPWDALTHNNLTSSKKGLLMAAAIAAGGYGLYGLYGAGASAASGAAAGAAGMGAGEAAAAGLGTIAESSLPAFAMPALDGSAISSALGMEGLGAGTAGAAGAMGAAGAGAASEIPQVLVSAGQGSGGLSSALFPETAGIDASASIPTSMPIDSSAFGGMPSMTSFGGSGGGGAPSASSFPTSGLGDLVKGVGQAASGYADYKMNQADQGYYQGLMDKMTGMYQPGTPEANLMEQKMNAQDAAAGRNSQYGVRAQNLAGMLAQQRAQVMTSPTFGKLAEASRGHYDSSLSSLSNLFGNATTSGTPLNGLINTGASYLGNLFS